MSAPSFPALLPLPSNWTEHIGPNGQKYYFNSQTRESTYFRPSPVAAHPGASVPQGSTLKREKPLLKTKIPGTEWLRVTTTAGNVFYSHNTRKESVWTVPDEIKDALVRLERKGQLPEHQDNFPIGEDETGLDAVQVAGGAKKEHDHGKRKAEETKPADNSSATKRAKVEEGEDENEEESEESEEEDWEREAAVQLAEEAEVEKKRIEQEEIEEERQKVASASKINMPDQVNLSIEEAKALFKTLLHEKDINPLHPWDMSLPKFISDPRYVLLSSVAARREAFDEYCRDRARELRQSAVKKANAEANPQEEYEHLLKSEVKSTRLTWTDFRRTWKNDRRFHGWGRNDRVREKRFREFIKDLGEKKRAAAVKVEAEFFALLRDRLGSSQNILWKEVKKSLSDDPRYDAIGSSSLREELFNTFLKGTSERNEVSAGTSNQHKIDDKIKVDKQEKKDRAVQEREDKIKAQRNRLDADIERSRKGINIEEGRNVYNTLLVDAIRDPQETWDSAVNELKTDPRFTQSPLTQNQQLHLFHAHIAHLRMKSLTGLHALFEAHAPSLSTTFSALPLDSLLASAPVTKLGFDVRGLEQEFNVWERERNHAARQAFDEMLGDNAFVEFWGRLGKIGGEGVDSKVQFENDDIGEDDVEGVPKVDMKALAKNVDIREMEKVLKNDKRFIMFDHVPEQRERWLRDYLAKLPPPNLSVHIPS